MGKYTKAIFHIVIGLALATLLARYVYPFPLKSNEINMTFLLQLLFCLLVNFIVIVYLYKGIENEIVELSDQNVVFVKASLLEAIIISGLVLLGLSFVLI